MDSINSLRVLLTAHESGQKIARTIAELLIDEEGTILLEEKLEEVKHSLKLLCQKLSASEQDVLRIVESSNGPVSVDQVVERTTKRSLRYRNHASMTLRHLLQKGRIKRVGKDGQMVLYSKKEPNRRF
jgi:Fe2+ or Zn2+ uptake regulation protein